ncbi:MULTISPECIES: nuclear transport factor 2 family protein [Pseudomonas]|uniref:nuclear transport factor 2 family protein n=1 Tax=Pseudomonas TaxID=286 RepID=UPI00123B7A62|nr:MULTISPECIES: nuclear transport factor 2 family protein [Pseudomonas]QIB49888.1 nuclear transport factor 2 family protein [Pseudomonas sp. OIL-1]
MTDLQQMQAQLQRLTDLEAIRTLRYRYAYLANVVDGQLGDAEAFASLFCVDGVLDFGMGQARGREEIASMLRAAAVDWQCAMHYMLNPVIDLQGDEAEGQVSGLFAFTTQARPQPVWFSNLYEDQYVRTDGDWQFRMVRVRTTFVDPAVVEAYTALWGNPGDPG